MPATIYAEHEHNVGLAQDDGYTVVSHPMQCVELDVSQGVSITGASVAGVQGDGLPELVQRRADEGRVSIPARIIGCVAAFVGYRFH